MSPCVLQKLNEVFISSQMLSPLEKGILCGLVIFEFNFI